MKLAVAVLLAAGLATPGVAQGLPGTEAGAAAGAALGAAPMTAPATAAPAGVVSGPMAPPDASAVNDYPTDARAEYVFACMAVNGHTADVLRRCSCSIDVIASILPYDLYVEAETVLAMLQTTGERVEVMRSAPPAKAFVQALRRAQAEGSARCF